MQNNKLLNINDAAIQIDNTLHQVTLNKFSVDTPEFFQLIVKQETPAEQINETRKVIEIGSFVKTKVEMVMDTDFIESRIKDMTHGFQSQMQLVQKEMIEKVDENFNPEQEKSYTARINRFFKEKSKEFQDAAEKVVKDLIEQNSRTKENFNPENKNSYLGQLITFVDDFKDSLEKQFDVKQAGSLTHELKELLQAQFGKNGELTKSVEERFSRDKSDSFASQLFNKLEEIRADIKATKSASDIEQETIQKSTLKGYDFEDLVEGKLNVLAAFKGDIVENLSTTPGAITRSKKGDFLYTIKAINKTIVIETRSRKMGTVKETLDEMNKSKNNRTADYVIHLTELEEHLHAQVGIYQEYDNDKLITHFGLLEIALKVAISRLMIENKEIEGIDRSAVEAEITSITNAIKSFKGIKTAAKNIHNEADKILSQSEHINQEIGKALNNLNVIILDKNN